MKLNQKNFDTLLNNLNHKMTSMESDIKWLKHIAIGIFITLIIGVFT